MQCSANSGEVPGKYLWSSLVTNDLLCSAVRRHAPGHLPVLKPATCLCCVTVLSEEVPLVVSRQLMLVFAQDIFKLPAEVYKPVATQ